MRLSIFLIFNIFISYLLSAQGLTKNGQYTTTGINFVNINGKIVNNQSLSKYGKVLSGQTGQISLLKGLVGYWTLDEVSGNTIDMASVHDGTPHAIMQGVPGKIGTAYSFVKSNTSYVFFGSIPLTINSISLWARRSGNAESECLIGFGDNHTGLWIGEQGDIYLSNDLGEHIATWGKWTETSTLHHIVLITSSVGPSGIVELYIDGISQGERSCIPPGVAHFVIGSEYANGTFNSPGSFSGVIDEVGLWGKALSSFEVKELYFQGAGQTYPFNSVTLPDVNFYVNIDGSVVLRHSAGNKRVILEYRWPNEYVRFSSDNGVSYNEGIKFPWDGSMVKARILENGNIVLFGDKRIYYSNDNLTTITPCNVLDKGGAPYSYHEPVNPANPGGYFDSMGGFVEYNGVSVLGNYANSASGASPINLYYSLDGITWKVFYTFGQNPFYTDIGTTHGGTGGTLLGDPNNNLITRHIHAVNVGGDGNFYVSTGDGSFECHFLKCSYNKINDTWEVNDLLDENSTSCQRMRSLGIFERNGYLYWGSDGRETFTYNGVEYDCLGIYKCAVSDINDPSKHILLQSLPDVCYSFLNVGNIVFVGLQSYGYVYISFDYGETWSSYAKPPYHEDSVEKVWYNYLYKYFSTDRGLTITSELF
jgi:hypothetical protein